MKGTCIAALATVGVLGQPALADDTYDIFAMPDRPSLNFYGSPGLVDMPTAQALPDGQFAVGVSSFGGITRTTVTFQATPRLSASFRYVGIQDWNTDGFETYRDRSFDVRYQLRREGRIWPSLTVGLQDFAGTGIYAGEYVVATKTFDQVGSIPGSFKLTAGLGWGRLGSSGAIGAPFGGPRPPFDAQDRGGSPSFDQWFRGDAAPFAGVEWQINDRWGLKAEYSSDAYEAETVRRNVFTRKSRFNFGAEYQYSDRLRIGAYYLYGSEFGINAQLQLNPKQPPTPLRVLPTPPIEPRPSRAAQPEVYDTAWAQSESAPRTLRDRLKPVLESYGLTLVALQVGPASAELRMRNDTYGAMSVAVGRAARAMAQVLPASVETFRIVPMQEGLAQSAVIMRRSDLEALEFDPQAAEALLAVTGFGAATPDLPGAAVNGDLYPDFAWSIGPYVDPSYFDPDEPIRADAGVKGEFTFRPAAGWEIGGAVKHRLLGNIGDSARLSNSQLPRVRTDGILYARASDTSLENLYVSRQWKPGNDIYARVTAGYLERMFGGVSAEVLWKPVASRLALGAEANYVKQRAYSGLGFRDYNVATGHASAYYEFGGGYIGQLDVGRYLAGDVGGTVTLTREFSNGWRVGGFFTLTDVSSEEFGEGSFDKGINLSIPVSWFLGTPGKRTISTTIRPIQRDGGARLNVPGRLYEQVRSGHREAIESEWSRVWE
ncbi:YjbH domain-containing protein [Sulfitobacter alexandrii]|uniref:YjbH domain-containing protein n=1 Tax=Sulfitobacter alexandrii TaxID=1917485 RepID=UPI001F2E6A72|nr:YjbH domain-containing protein [Sulfitobacter alexandrii]